MKKSIILLFVLIGFLLVGCNKTEDVTLSASPTSVTLEIGEEKVITPKIEGTEKDVKFNFESDNLEVATVDAEGKVKAVGSGSAKITVTVEEFSKLKATVNVTVNEEEIDPSTQLTVSGPTTVVAGEEIQLTAVDKADQGHGVMWVALTAGIAKISQTGLVTGVKPGTAQFEVHSLENGTSKAFSIEVTEAPVSEVSISANIGDAKIKTTASYKLSATVLPKAADQNVVWETSDDSIALISEDGFVTISTYGEVTFTAKSIQDGTKKATLTVEFHWDVMDLMDYIIIENPVVDKNAFYYGYEAGYEKYPQVIKGSVTSYYFGTYPYYEKIAPSTNENRPGILQPSTEFVTVHDTGSAAPGATASAHANYVYNGGGGTSWHYSIGNDGVYLQIPLNEISYHASDGSRVYGMNDTGVKAVSKIKPTLGIDSTGFYTLNGVKTIVEAPRHTDGSILTAAAINDYGIAMQVGTNGNWFINNSYYSTQGPNISNQGGNRNSIGIETMVNAGSDVFLTWHYTAKIVSEVLLANNLGLDRQQFHHSFSGKNCPQTMRRNGLVGDFRKLVEAEYLIAKFFGDYTFTLTSNNPEYVDNHGKIIKLPDATTQVSFLVEVTHPTTGVTSTKYYYSTIKI